MTSSSIRVDYHFHPNFPFWIPLVGRFLSKRKAQSIWKAFSRHNVHLIFVSEHVYKRPRRAFEFLLKHRPEGSETHLVPSIEYLTSEGVDIIVFAERPENVYCHRDLLIPWKLSVDQVVKMIIYNENLYGIVVHPCTPGTTSILRGCGKEVTLQAIRDLGFLEVHNCSSAALQELMDVLKVSKLLRNKYQQVVETKHAPDYLKLGGVVFTGGSDAHQAWEIGDCMEIESEYRNNQPHLFNIATSQSGVPSERDRHYKRTLLLSSITVLHEWILKKTRLYTVDKPL